MTVYNENRFYEVGPDGIPIWLTRFNAGQWFDAKMLNHCADGMCLQSHCYFPPGTPVLIRAKSYASDVSCNDNFEGVPTITMGEVKWCRESPNTTPSSYDVGVKYYPPPY
ncbi:hypothetical protein ACFL9U_14500 [Thermodesulfobacteriota bacterium]